MLVSLLLLAACSDSAGPTVLEDGRDVYGANCSVCHGPRGRGEIGPSLVEVVETWPTCDAHLGWIELGSDGWIAAGGGSYGATGKPVQGGMPPFATILDSEELAAVAAYERIEFGGAAQEATLSDCGLAEAE